MQKSVHIHLPAAFRGSGSLSQRKYPPCGKERGDFPADLDAGNSSHRLITLCFLSRALNAAQYGMIGDSKGNETEARWKRLDGKW